MKYLINFIKSVFLLLIICFLMVIPVKAEMCERNDIYKLKLLANQISVEYVYVEDSYMEDNGDRYTISVGNLSDELYIIVNDESEYSLVNGQEYVQFEEFAGELVIDIYASYCDERLKTIKLELPFYNTYADSDECQDLKDKYLEVCDEWYQGSLDTEKFREYVDKYLEDDTPINFISFVREYFEFVTVGIIVFIIGIVILVNRYKRRNVLK